MRTETELTSQGAKHPMHDEAFKEQAVLLMAEGTRSIEALARELGVSAKTLRNWRQRYGAAGDGVRSAQTSLRVCAQGDGARGPVALAAEVARLQADLRHVTIQRDILKKALAIVGQTSPTATR
jgi:transposase-like protein